MTVVKDWVTEAAVEILDSMDARSCDNYQKVLAAYIAIILKHCPFKEDTAYVEVGAPVMQLLRGSRREHRDDCFLGDNPDQYTRSLPTMDCTCGADEWNRRVDEVLR